MADFELADDFLPTYDVSDAVATVADADRETAWQALLDVDLLRLGREAPVVGMLGALRMLPEVVGHLLHGERPAKPPASMRLRDLPSIPMYEGGWILLGERPGEEIALGLVGKFWRPVIQFARITSADEFRDFGEPGFAKTVYDLSVRELAANETLLSGLMRTATTDEHARRWFRRYWAFGVGSGAHILVGALVALARPARTGSRWLLQLPVAREPGRLPDGERRPHPSRVAAPRAGRNRPCSNRGAHWGSRAGERSPSKPFAGTEPA